MTLIHSHLLNDTQFAAMQIKAQTLEQDERGVKVLLLANGHILKVFRLRGLFTSSRIYSNARSFCRNAERLKKLAIPTVSIIQLYHFEKSKNTAVLYEPLAGETIRNLLEHGMLTDEICLKLGVFIARLHALGIHFKSLHFGNIVMTPVGELGLIDIADMRIFPWSLQLNTRIRGFKRLLRYCDDVEKLGESRWMLLLQAYFGSADLSIKIGHGKMYKLIENLISKK
jgi:hypothetical protein